MGITPPLNLEQPRWGPDDLGMGVSLQKIKSGLNNGTAGSRALVLQTADQGSSPASPEHHQEGFPGVQNQE